MNVDYNKKKGIYDEDGSPKLRIWHKKKQGKNSARFLVKCGDCENKLEIFYDTQDPFLEIGGIHASIDQWQRILCQLLRIKRPKESSYLKIPKVLFCRKCKIVYDLTLPENNDIGMCCRKCYRVLEPHNEGIQKKKDEDKKMKEMKEFAEGLAF